VPLTHSINVSNTTKADWNTALTWNPAAFEQGTQAIDKAATALMRPSTRDAKPTLAEASKEC
jgi:hypothetical protein